jgi:hypothetical protein
MTKKVIQNMKKTISKKIFQTMKVIDCHIMPDDVRDQFFKSQDDLGTPNDSYVDWFWDEEAEIVNSWLTENGLTKKDKILIKHWW